MLQKILALILRHALTGAGAYLAAQGYLADGDRSQFVGAGMCLAGVAWSAYEKYSSRKKAENAAFVAASAAIAAHSLSVQSNKVPKMATADTDPTILASGGNR